MKRVWIVCAVALAACHGEDSSTPSNAMKDNLGVSFSEIKGLAIGQAASASVPTSEADSNQLLVLDNQDQLQPADLTTQGPGNPRAVIDTPKFVLVTASDVTHDGQPCLSVLIRKSDSAMFCVPTAPVDSLSDNSARVQWDSTGDVAVLHSGTTLNRLELGASDVTQTTLSFEGAELVNFAVNAAGDVMVNLRQDGGSVVRIYPRTGGPVFVTARHTSCVFPGLLGSKDFYVSSGFSDASTVDRVEARTDGTYADPVRTWETGPGVWNDCELVYRSASRLLITPPTRLLELLNPEGTPRVLSSVGFKVARGESLFDWGQDADGRAFVRRYDLPDYTPVELLTAAPYRLGKVDVSPTGEFTAVATRLSDGAHVVLSIKGGTVSVNELPASQPEIITLVRIR